MWVRKEGGGMISLTGMGKDCMGKGVRISSMSEQAGQILKVNQKILEF